MYFKQLLHEDRSCASYLVGCPTLGVCAAVDPQGDPMTYVAKAAEAHLAITHVIDTHVHADHPSAARALAEAATAPLYLGARAQVGFASTGLEDGEILEVGNRRIEVMSLPGHTPEHVGLVVDDWFVLTGDTLFVGDVGRVDLSLTEDGDDAVRGRARELHESLRKLLALRDDIEIYPGHYAGSTCGRGMDGKPISTIGRERRQNSALSLGADDFVDYQLSTLPPLPDDFHAIKRANTGA